MSRRKLSEFPGQISAPRRCEGLEQVRPIIAATDIYAGDAGENPLRRSVRPDRLIDQHNLSEIQ